MRILHVVPTYLPAVRYGGPIFAVHGLCQALVARGHKVEVFTTNIDGPAESLVPVATPMNMDGVQVRYFACPLIRRLYWAPALRRALQEEVANFDIVHLHSVFLWPTWVAARAARKAGIPYVLSPRGMLIKSLIDQRNWVAKSAWINLIERSNIQNAAAIHLTSQLELAEIQSFGWRLPQVDVIANGVDEPQPVVGDFAADIQEIVAEQPLVLSLGRLSWKKGLERLLRGFARTRTGHLAIVGTDDENLASNLSIIAADLGIIHRVKILPRTVAGADKERLFASARLFVLSSHSENFGNTVLEAMRRGVPVVLTPEVGAAEIIRESRAGLVVAGDAEPLGAAMQALIADAGLARSMGEAGRRHAVAHYTWARIAGRMERLYENIGRRDCVVSKE